MTAKYLVTRRDFPRYAGIGFTALLFGLPEFGTAAQSVTPIEPDIGLN